MYEVDLSECQIWEGPALTAGRGFRYGYPTINGKHVLAHRYVWEQANGTEIPKGMVVRHKCDNTLCVNPDHLELGTQHDNVMDMVKRGRHGNSVKSAKACWKGHPRTPENTYVRYRASRGKYERTCRVCKREYAKRMRKQHTS